MTATNFDGHLFSHFHRWGGTPYDDAVREKHFEVAEYLKSRGGRSGDESQRYGDEIERSGNEDSSGEGMAPWIMGGGQDEDEDEEEKEEEEE